jgi:hypothetical protein
MPNARLCIYEFPNGKLCRQVALKDEQGCRHHMRPFRHGMYEITHEEARDRLQQKLNTLDLPSLLRTLQAKLNKIQSTLRSHPEAQLTLTITLERLRQITATHSNQDPFTEDAAPSMS